MKRLPAFRFAVRFCTLLCVVPFSSLTIGAQDTWTWPEKPKNLQVLPKDWPGSRLRPVMSGFSRSLGVRCSYCHKGEEGKPLSTYDFASDTNPNKNRAREMLRMLSCVPEWSASGTNDCLRSHYGSVEAVMMGKLIIRALIILSGSATLSFAQAAQPLQLETTIELPDVQGRIDHMSIDVKGQRLFVSALGNNTVEVIDVKAGKRINTIHGLQEPQGVLYAPAANRIYVANDKDGSVRIFDGTSLKALKTLEYRDDADNLRFDSARQHIYVGFGDGGLGEFDTDGQKTSETKLDAHPESFQLEKNSQRIYVNLPKSFKIAVVDRDKHSVIATWRTGGPQANYPMALDEADHRLFVVTRFPARLLVFNTETGKVIQSLSAVGDCDDVFYDQARKRIYASGGEGAISVFEQQAADQYKEIARITTVKGARTSFFSPELSRLYLAVRRQGSHPASIQVFEPR